MSYAHATTLVGSQPNSRDEARERAFGEVVRRHRQARGWSRARLGDELSWDAKGVRRVEDGERLVTLRSAHRLADVLGVSLILLLAEAEGLLMEQEAAA
jgi:ribosome-binding protein aMBF1 (putative translation factor)